jgi:Holliday junction DNA helicase RuvA
MYSYLRGTFQGIADESVILEVNGVGYDVVVPPIVRDEIGGVYQDGMELKLWVSTQSTRDQPWPTLFGFLQPSQRDFWDLLRSLPRIGGKGAARAMSVPIPRIAQAIQEGNSAYLDGLPGITVDGAAKMIAGLRKKVAPYLKVETAARVAQGGSTADDIRDDAVQVLTVMGVKRPDAQKGVDELLEAREDLVTAQDVITAYLRQYGRS